METKLVLETPDGAFIYGALRQQQDKPSRKLIIHLHGLTHTHQHYLPICAADYFVPQSYDHFRFSFYWIEYKARRLPDANLRTHVQDLDTVLTRFRGDYDAIYLIGHSLGGLTALIANPPSIQAMSLWDPSFDVTAFWSTGPFLTPMPERKQYLLDYGNVYVLGDAMVEDIKRWPDRACLEQARTIATPVQLIIPDESIFLASPNTSPEQYKTAFPSPFDLTRIPKANHTFTYEGSAEKLFNSTLKWFSAHQP